MTDYATITAYDSTTGLPKTGLSPTFESYFNATTLVAGTAPTIAEVDAANLPGVYRYFDTTSVIKECFDKLGPHIAACHLKDITLADELTVHLSECMVGEGGFDIATYLLEIQKLPHQPPVLLEHMKTKEEFDHARDYILGLAQQIGMDFGG